MVMDDLTGKVTGEHAPINSHGLSEAFNAVPHLLEKLVWIGGRVFLAIPFLLLEPTPEDGPGAFMLCLVAFMLGGPRGIHLVLHAPKRLREVIQRFGATNMWMTPNSISP